jgi:probable rRNA maturation factor
MTEVVVRQRRVPLSAARLARTANRALAAVGRADADVEVLMVDDAQMRRLNRTWRSSGRRTDVLAFPLEIPEARGRLLGQVVVSAETAARQAREIGVSVSIELDLLVTHGILHLVGYDDHDPVQARRMHKREQTILSAGRRRPIPARLWQGLLS